MKRLSMAAAVVAACCSGAALAGSTGHDSVQAGATSGTTASSVKSQSSMNASSGSSAPSSAGTVITTQPNYSDPMKRLLDAAQSFRDATHAMLNLPAGEQRNDAIRTANKALLETQDAMVALPPDLRNASTAPKDPQAAMKRLQTAADDLRKFTQAVADAPAGNGRNQAIRDANQALFTAQQAMIDLPQQTTASR